MTDAVDIICIDDDPVCLEQLRANLEKVRIDLNARFFSSSDEALSAHAKAPADVVLTDLHLGDVNGIDLIATMRNSRPNARYALLSEDADLQSFSAAVNEVHLFRFLIKPADEKALEGLLRAVVADINLRELRRLSIVSHSAVETMRRCIIYLDTDYRVIYSNDSARRLIERSHVFDIGRDKIFRSAHHRETLSFQEMLRNLRVSGKAEAERKFFRFSGRVARQPITASVVYHAAAALAPPYYSVALSDPEAQKTTVESITAALDILPSEARVVQAIVQGLTVEEAARQAQISLQSARTYLRSVYEKTGVARRDELVRLVLLTAA